MSDPFFDVTPGGEATDAAERSAIEQLRGLFEANRSKVYFSRQLEILHEGERFHWITNRALRDLLAEGLVVSDERQLTNGNAVNLVWHRSYRYPVRAAKLVVDLVDEYAAPAISAAVGQHAEFLVLEGFARNRFVMEGREANAYRERQWTRTAHDLDFIFERDGIGYGIEVKNALGYMDYTELTVKIMMCKHLALRPVFVVRMMPRTWINEVVTAGGFVLVLKYQLYPLAHKDLAKRVRETLTLPVDTPKALQEGTMQRFVNWHERQVGRQR